MNRIFRIVWNRTLGQLVVTSEHARSAAKGGRSATGGFFARPFLARSAFGAALALCGLPFASAHTISVGYTNSGSGNLTFWYGTYHSPTEANHFEGQFQLVGPNGYSQLVDFTQLVSSTPDGLEDGVNNFYAAGQTGTTLTPDNETAPLGGGPVQTWQGVSFSNLLPGVYTYTYVPIANPTQAWHPWEPVLTNVLTISGADLNGYPLENGGVYDQTTPQLNDPYSILFNNGTFKPTEDTTRGQQVTVRSGGGTVDTSNGDVVFTGGVDGNGTLTKAGDGTLVLTGPSTYTGGTVVEQGTLQGDTGSLQGHIDNDGTVVFSQNGDGSFGGTIDGNGNVVKNGAGAVTFTDANGYDGATIVNDGKIVLSGNGSIGSGGIVVDGTLDTSAANHDTTGTTLAGNGSVVLGANDLHLTDAHDAFGGTISGTGGLDVNGGTQALLGTNTYSGGTTVSNGATVSIADDAALGTGGLTLDDGTLHLSGSTNSSRNVTVIGTGTIDNTGGTTFANAGTVSGSGDFVKSGQGILVQDGDLTQGGKTIVDGGLLVLESTHNTYAGGTVVNSGGALQISSDANLGASTGSLALNGGVLYTTETMNTSRDVILGGGGIFTNDTGETLALNGTVSGAGGLTQAGMGTLVLTGDNTYTGGTTIRGGTLQVSSDTNLGDASNGITIDGGNLAITKTMTTDRDILIGAHGASITTLDGVTLNQRGDMSGSGGLVKLGGGTLVVSGNNSFTGGTLIQGGVIRIDSGSSLGTGAILLQGGTLQTVATLGTGQQVIISGDSGVNVDAGTTTVLSGSLVASAGDGCFVKSGKGRLSLTGQSNLASGTCVQDGQLSANGDLSSTFVQVDAAGTLRGTGRIAGPVNVQGRLAAGNSPGTLTVAGTVTMQAGSTLQVDIDGLGTGNGAGNYSRVLVTGAGNQFVANGTLEPTLRGITGDASNTYTPAIGSTYRIVTAEGGVTGRFTTIDQPTDGLAANTRFIAFYGVDGGHSIDLRVAPVSYAQLLGGAAKRNGLAAASVLDSGVAAQDAGVASAAQTALLYAVSSLGADRVAAMAGSLSGEVHADQAAAARAAGLGMQRDVTDHLGTDVTGADTSHHVWANLTRDGNRSIADGQGSGFETGTDRTTGGVDLYAENGTVIGLAATHHDTNVIAHGGQGTIRGNSGIVYAQQALGRFVVDGMAAYGTTDWTTRRMDPLGGSSLEMRTSGKDTMASATLRLPMQTAGGSRIEPYASVIWQKVERDAAGERGGSFAGLSLDKLSEKGTRVLAGVTLGSKAADPLASTLTWRAGVAVGADTGDLLDPTVHNTLAGQRFDTAAPGVGRGFVQVNANGTMRLGKSTYLYGGLTAEEGSRRSAYGVTAGVRVSF
ncbi:autotransporter-associated beta strand repeat-containing protein [Luteibacter yeojuensis]